MKIVGLIYAAAEFSIKYLLAIIWNRSILYFFLFV